MDSGLKLTGREVQCLVNGLNCLLRQLERTIDVAEIEAAVLRDILAKLREQDHIPALE